MIAEDVQPCLGIARGGGGKDPAQFALVPLQLDGYLLRIVPVEMQKHIQLREVEEEELSRTAGDVGLGAHQNLSIRKRVFVGVNSVLHAALMQQVEDAAAPRDSLPRVDVAALRPVKPRQGLRRNTDVEVAPHA